MAVTLVSDDEEHFLRKIEVLQESDIPLKGAQSLRFHKNKITQPEFTCISLSAGKKGKASPRRSGGCTYQRCGHSWRRLGQN